MDPQRKRAQVLSALLEQLTGLARRGPVLMVFEDVQWSDPTSLELLTLTVERMQSAAGPADHYLPPGLPAALGRPVRMSRP